jgi:hypothetical protein
MFCNTHLEGNTMEFRKGVLRRYGQKVLDELDLLKKGGLTQKLYDQDYKEMAKHYRAQIKILKNNK